MENCYIRRTTGFHLYWGEILTLNLNFIYFGWTGWFAGLNPPTPPGWTGCESPARRLPLVPLTSEMPKSRGGGFSESGLSPLALGLAPWALSPLGRPLEPFRPWVSPLSPWPLGRPLEPVAFGPAPWALGPSPLALGPAPWALWPLGWPLEPFGPIFLGL